MSKKYKYYFNDKAWQSENETGKPFGIFNSQKEISWNWEETNGRWIREDKKGNKEIWFGNPPTVEFGKVWVPIQIREDGSEFYKYPYGNLWEDNIVNL